MRELSIVELELIVGGYNSGSYDYGSSTLYDDGTGTGDYAGVVYEADAQAMQAEASAQNIDWGVEGTVGNGGAWSVKVKVGGKS
jgi:hypothetical protein